jgi:hypothetical protein
MKTETRKQILDNAPEGATHWSEAYKEYLKVNLVRKSFLALEKDGEWAKSWVHEDFRSLSDMQAIVDLRTEKDKAEITHLPVNDSAVVMLKIKLSSLAF